MALAVIASAAWCGAAATARPDPAARADASLGGVAAGDWEGTVDGFPASFELVRDPLLAFGPYVPYGIEDVVLLTPDNCSLSPIMANAGVVGVPPLQLRTNGSFGSQARYDFKGTITGARTARITSSYDFPSAFGVAGCRGTLAWHLHPAHRVRVLDGKWKIHFSDGETQQVQVLGGGRLLVGFGTPEQAFQCGAGGGSYNLFINPNGKAKVNDTLNEAVVALSFGARHASGTFTAATGSCGVLKLTVAARLKKREA